MAGITLVEGQINPGAKMSKLEVSTQDFCDFINFCHLKGEVENKELLIKCRKDSLSALAVHSPTQAKDVCVNARLLGDFSDMGEVGIDDLTLLKNFLNSLNIENSKQISLKKNENKLVCETKKHKFSCVLRAPAYIVNNVGEEKFLVHFKKVESNSFKLSASTLSEIIGQIKALQSEFIVFTGTDKKLNIFLGRINNELEINLDLEKDVEKFQIKVFANKFVDIISCLTGQDLNFYMKNDSPVVIELKSEKCLYQYLISPLVKVTKNG